MTSPLTEPMRPAPGQPGLAATWAHGAKQGVGTSTTAASPVWFTLAEGVVSEVYFPRVDVPCTRDLQFLALLGGGEVVEERRDMDATVALIDPRALAYRVSTADRARRFRIDKEIVTDPERPSLALRVRWQGGPPRTAGGRTRRGAGPGTAAAVAAPDPAAVRLFVLLAPHVAGRGRGNVARWIQRGGRTLAVAHRHDTWLALAGSLPWGRRSCGFVGVNDGWTDLHRHGDLAWDYDAAVGGNVAVTGEVAGFAAGAFTLALGFGHGLEEACAAAIATADADFDALLAAYVDGWRAWCDGLEDLGPQSGDGGRLYHLSAMTLRAHEDKQNPGAHIASLAVPWGDATGDGNAGGYHLVWPRDLYHSATGRLAAGDAEGARAALRYLIRTQRADGSWPQNFWVYGEPYWRGLQLDELAFPILLAWQLKRAGELEFNPYPSLVAPAAYAVARVGPVTPQERWEENSGYSPSTLASAIAALVCAAEFAQEDRDPLAAGYFLDVADCWQQHIEEWTFTRNGSVLPGFPEYYERIATALPGEGGGGRWSFVPVANRAGADAIDAGRIIDGGFLELVRYGVREPHDRHVLSSLAVYDAVCRVETPRGPCWHRYNLDGYGQKDDGGPYDGTGVGRAWPLLTGERAHYELAAGADPRPLRTAMEAFAGPAGMLPEQVWDSEDIPADGLFGGQPTGSAAPLCWAHAEYVKLLRSLRDGWAFDRPESVRERYATPREHLDIWKFNHKIRTSESGARLCIEVYDPAALHWSADGWQTVHHEPLDPRGHGVWTHVWPAGSFAPGADLRFTFYWPESRTWEGRDFRIAIG